MFALLKRPDEKLVVEHVPDYATLFIDLGTTKEEGAKDLSRRCNLRVITNNLNVAAIMGGYPDCEVIITGGVARATSVLLAKKSSILSIASRSISASSTFPTLRPTARCAISIIGKYACRRLSSSIRAPYFWSSIIQNSGSRRWYIWAIFQRAMRCLPTGRYRQKFARFSMRRRSIC